MKSVTAGKGDPYWYEWTVGLLKVVEMLGAESEIQSVSFQAAGVKGWDDVVVRYADDRVDYIQVKHSRIGTNITFGDLVATDDKGSSLLNSLFETWKEMKLNSDMHRCILFTNRTSGESIGKSSEGIARPPLFDFVTWLAGQLKKVKTLRECKPPSEWRDAWQEWLDQLSSGTPAQRISFLKSFVVCANQADLSILEEEVLTSLGNIFQISHQRALPLFHALDNALRRWTTTHETVTSEDAFSAMALDEEPEIEHRAPPPPTPFFPSRCKTLSKIEEALINPNGPPLVFLCAEPGAGKTSLISELANRRVSESLQGLIGLRYFAFRPITPQSPLIPPDADHFVRPDRLWFSLLSQLRQGLKGKLQTYQVPLRNNLITWAEARNHVLRISSQLGKKLGRPFVIIIDGIDHAARSMRYEGNQAKDFFESLPGPDEIGNSPIRLMLSGQPPEAYPEYPGWLHVDNSKIKILNIGKLDEEDIRILLNDAKSPIPVTQEDLTIGIIEEATHGNTLAVVFAVEETRACNSTEKLRKRLAERQLQDGLQDYYKNIWQHTLSLLRNFPTGIEVALASALCLTPERLTGSFMGEAFAQLGVNSQQWEMLLGSLGPLLVNDGNGFRVLHNDVRVFLHGYLTGRPLETRRQGASMLADYYLNSRSNRWFTHKSLLRLLRDAGREVEWARIFTVNWVFEASALGIPYKDITDDCVAALHQGTVLKDWHIMLELACATETLERWEERCEIDKINSPSEERLSETTFFHTELFVRPLIEWKLSDLRNVIRDTELLATNQEIRRARGVLERWFGGLSIEDLCDCVIDLTEDPFRLNTDEFNLSSEACQILEELGAVCRSVNFSLNITRSKKEIVQNAQGCYEAGWVRVSCHLGPFDSLKSCFSNRPIFYFNSFETALRELALKGHWSLVRILMAHLVNNQNNFSHKFRAQAAWWALRSEAVLDNAGWLEIFNLQRFGFTENSDENFASALHIARALNWKDASAEPSGIAQRIYDALLCDISRQEDYQHFKLIFRAVATISRVRSILYRKGVEAAKEILPISEMVRLAQALWEFRFDGYNAYGGRRYAGRYALELVDLAFELGDSHRKALIEAAKPIAGKCPVDFRLKSIWRLFFRSGDVPQLRFWLDQWLGDNGWLWSSDVSDRESIADDLLPLTRELGENDLANRTEERLRWLKIGYRGHKEYSFDTPNAWFGELAKIKPVSWRDQGLRLWTLSEACSGDNRLDWEIGETLGAAAWSSGPTDVWKLFTAEYTNCGTESWFYPVANRIIGGLIVRLSRQPKLSWRDAITGWCLAVGFSRWFDDESVKALVKLRESLLNEAQSELDRNTISDAMRCLTPGEFYRQPRSNAVERESSNVIQEEGVDSWLKKIANGEEIHPCIAVHLLREVLMSRPSEFNDIACKVLDAVGVGAPYSWGWYTTKNYHDAVLEIGSLVSDEMLWRLVCSAIKYAGAGSAWTQGISRNLYCVLLSRAVKQGADELQKGISRILDMHEQWSRGGKRDLALTVIQLKETEEIVSWTELTAHILVFLLASRSAEVLESALIGIQALVSHDQSAIRLIIKLADGDVWKQHWITNAAEPWAVLFPEALGESRGILESWLKHGPLHLRLQTWIVLRRLAQVQEESLPPFPQITVVREDHEENLFSPTRNILETPVRQQGSIRFTDIYHSVESTIKYVESATSLNLEEVRSKVARALEQVVPEDFETQPWPVRIRCRGDLICNSLLANLTLDHAFDEYFSKNSLPISLQVVFAQSYLENENPWILRATPIPDEELSKWPSQEDLSEANKKSIDYVDVRKKLFLLACQHRIADDELILAARAQVFSYQEELTLHVWWEESASDSMKINSNSCPKTLSSRTFAFDFDDWWEPFSYQGDRSLTFAVGGHQRLAFCFPEFMPSKLWRTEFGWEPAKKNPLMWFKRGNLVARYERIHGASHLIRADYRRQPILERWVVKKNAWEEVKEVLGSLRMRDAFERFNSRVDC